MGGKCGNFLVLLWLRCLKVGHKSHNIQNSLTKTPTSHKLKCEHSLILIFYYYFIVFFSWFNVIVGIQTLEIPHWPCMLGLYSLFEIKFSKISTIMYFNFSFSISLSHLCAFGIYLLRHLNMRWSLVWNLSLFASKLQRS